MRGKSLLNSRRVPLSFQIFKRTQAEFRWGFKFHFVTIIHSTPLETLRREVTSMHCFKRPVCARFARTAEGGCHYQSLRRTVTSTHCFKLLVCARFARTAEGGCLTHIFCNHHSCPLVVWNRIRHASGGFPSPYTFLPVGMKERRPPW